LDIPVTHIILSSFIDNYYIHVVSLITHFLPLTFLPKRQKLYWQW